uniref:Uncharacterized protein n=1 Tax=Oryza sativa subsp. japonica TaxID=39947 RepID=Q653D4_ORYSJ|nr:hypothetical protein [Oryza sativa Japonica Group]
MDEDFARAVEDGLKLSKRLVLPGRAPPPAPSRGWTGRRGCPTRPPRCCRSRPWRTPSSSTAPTSRPSTATSTRPRSSRSTCASSPRWRPEREKKERGGADGWSPRCFSRGHTTMARHMDKSGK